MKRTVDFIGVGCLKSGTTWLAKCLGLHPEIACNYKMGEKDLSFFNNKHIRGTFDTNFSNYHKGINWYYSNLPYKEGSNVLGEFSVNYILDPVAPERIYNLFPETKIIVSIRNPTDMLFSLYNFLKSGVMYEMPNTFDEFMKLERNYKTAFYGEQIERYIKLFPKENIHIIIFDDIVNKPEFVLKSLYNFLGVKNINFLPDNYKKKVNKTFIPRSSLIHKSSKYIINILKNRRLEFIFEFTRRNVFFIRLYSKINKVERKVSNKLSVDKKSDYLKLFKEDIIKLEKISELDLSIWK
jgi:hypothetical protein